MKLYAHPFSSYCQKVLIALYENDIPFDYRLLDRDEQIMAEHLALWPMRRMPVLVDGERTLVESTIIIEYLDSRYRGNVVLIPEDRDDALDVRMLDRFFDNYVMTPMQKIVLDHLRPADQSDRYGVAEARKALDAAYAWLDTALAGHDWAAGAAFTLADCAAAPSLFYADWVQDIGARHPNVLAYRSRLLARPSVARAVNEARPFRHLFPAGAPDRD